MDQREITFVVGKYGPPVSCGIGYLVKIVNADIPGFLCCKDIDSSSFQGVSESTLDMFVKIERNFGH
jgi:hypothetical protein